MARRRKRTPRRGVQLVLLACVLLAVSSVAPGFASAHRHEAGKVRDAAAAPLFGINIVSPGDYSSFAAIDRTVAQAHALHASVVRTDFPWSMLEPRGPEFEPRSLALADRIVADAAADGMRVLVMTDSTPCWASSAPAALLRRCSPSRTGPANAWPPRADSTYAAFMAALAARYGSRLAALEVWNEPDQSNEQYWAGPEKAQRYASLLRATYPAIKAVDPNLPVLGGSLVGPTGTFLRALYADGIKGYYDGLAVHYYTLTVAALHAIHEVQVANGDHTPLWLDEFGWSSCWPVHRVEQDQGCVTRAVQAANLLNTFRILAQTPYVAAASSYTLQDISGEEFGVLGSSGGRKPAFDALEQALTAPFGAISPVTVSLHKSGSHIEVSGSGPVGDFLGLEVFKGSVLRYRAVFTLDRFNRYSVAVPSVVGTRGLRARVFQYYSARAAEASI